MWVSCRMPLSCQLMEGCKGTLQCPECTLKAGGVASDWKAAIQNHDSTYSFRQSDDKDYINGCCCGAQLVILPGGGFSLQAESWMVLRVSEKSRIRILNTLLSLLRWVKAKWRRYTEVSWTPTFLQLPNWSGSWVRVIRWAVSTTGL